MATHDKEIVDSMRKRVITLSAGKIIRDEQREYISSMLIRNFLYYIKEAFCSIGRNGWMSFASISVVTITLLILGSFILFKS